MSYLVLARRWRPQQFSELVGQPHVARTMLNGLRQGRVAHAYIFSGPRGVGKTTTARLVAKAINCHTPQEGEPCGKCGSCQAVSESRAIDVIEIDAASNRGIDEIRQLRDSVRYAPIEGRAKIYIIDEVHMLTTEAFNALLKTLEEPPEHAYFCLATTASQKVPSTILSRCQRFDFRRVPISELKSHLEKICTADGYEFEPEALDIIARRADGSVRDSLSLLDQVIAFGEGRVTLQDAEEVAGEIRLDLFFQAIHLVESGSAAAVFSLDSTLAEKGIDLQDFISGLQSHLIQILRTKTLGVDAIEAPDEFKDNFVSAANLLGEEDVVRLLQFCATAEIDIRRNYNARTRLQLLLLKFATFERSIVLADLLSDLQQGRAPAPRATRAPVSRPKVEAPVRKPQSSSNANKSVSKPDSSIEPAKEAEPERPSVTQPSDEAALLAVQNAWDSICEQVAVRHNSSGHMIKFSGFPASLKNGVMKIHFRKKVHVDSARSCLETLSHQVRKVAGEVSLDLVVGEVPDRPDTETAPEEDEAVKMIQDRLGGKLIN